MELESTFCRAKLGKQDACTEVDAHHGDPPTSCPHIASDPVSPCFVDRANFPTAHPSAFGLDDTIGGHTCRFECTSHQRDEDDSGQFNDGYPTTKPALNANTSANCIQRIMEQNLNLLKWIHNYTKESRPKVAQTTLEMCMCTDDLQWIFAPIRSGRISLASAV